MMGLCPLGRGDEFAIITCPLRLKYICCRSDEKPPSQGDAVAVVDPLVYREMPPAPRYTATCCICNETRTFEDEDMADDWECGEHHEELE